MIILVCKVNAFSYIHELQYQKFSIYFMFIYPKTPQYVLPHAEIKATMLKNGKYSH